MIIDDIQEFAGVTKTQNTFFHIFNHLHQNGKQLILTSDRAPVLLQGMEERLITRFKWGMVAELEKPTVELRKNILRNKIHRDGLQFPPEVIDYIAENVGNSVRDSRHCHLHYGPFYDIQQGNRPGVGTTHRTQSRELRKQSHNH